MREKKPHQDLIELADGLHGHSTRLAGVGEFTKNSGKFDELKSEDVINCRPAHNKDLNLNGKPRRGRYSRAIQKK